LPCARTNPLTACLDGQGRVLSLTRPRGRPGRRGRGGACVAGLQDAKLAHKVSGDEDGYPEGFMRITRATSNDDPALTQAHVVGGTAFFSSRPECEQALDWLFVDEAGQVGLANMVAMARAARNIVLVGDPRQLPQVIQGAHPNPANLSCLDWMLGDHATVPPNRGIFLPVSRRMHPEVCRFISGQVYEGRLTSHPDTLNQAVTGTALSRLTLTTFQLFKLIREIHGTVRQ
jgi:hypothetical protein